MLCTTAPAARKAHTPRYRTRAIAHERPPPRIPRPRTFFRYRLPCFPPFTVCRRTAPSAPVVPFRAASAPLGGNGPAKDRTRRIGAYGGRARASARHSPPHSILGHRGRREGGTRQGARVSMTPQDTAGRRGRGMGSAAPRTPPYGPIRGPPWACFLARGVFRPIARRGLRGGAGATPHPQLRPPYPIPQTLVLCTNGRASAPNGVQ